jgi:hypothetical protein
MRVRKVKVIADSVGFPGDELMKEIDPGIPFPTVSQKHMVNCTFQDEPGEITFKPHMNNGGSCRVPNGFTITLAQWKRQQSC